MLLTVVTISSVSSHTFPPGGKAQADASRIVAVYADGAKLVLSSDAATVGELLQRAHIELAPGDLVEPAATQAITGNYMSINVYRARPVTVVDGAATYHILAAQRSARLLATAAGLHVYPEDTVKLDTITNFVADGSVGDKVTITRAIPFSVTADGSTRQLRAQGTTVADALKAADISLGVKDQLSVPATAPLTPGLAITVTRVSDVTTTVNEVLHYITQTTYDNTLPRGTSQIKQAGQDGHRTVTYHIVYRNGVEVSRATLNVSGLVKPVAQVQVVGTHVYYANETIALGEQMAAARGWVNDQWDSLYQLWMHESGWNPYAVNPYSGACGIPQANPCSKIGSSDPAVQITWGLGYIAQRYGDPDTAWAYWKRNGSY